MSLKLLPVGVQISSVRRDHRNQLPDASIMLRIGDGLLVVAERQDAIGEVADVLGRVEPGRLGKDRSDLSYQRFFVSRPRPDRGTAGRVADAGWRSPPCPASSAGTTPTSCPRPI